MKDRRFTDQEPSGGYPSPSYSVNRRTRALGGIAVTVALLPLAGCKHSAEKEAVAAPMPAAVVTQLVRVGDVRRQVTVTGSIVALQDVALSAKQGGRLTDVAVREGDSVVAGQVLARIDATDLQSQVSSDRASVDSAQAKLAQARAAYNQQVTTTETTIASARAAYQQQVATSRAQIRSARAALASARAALSTEQEGARPEERLQTQATLASAEANHKKAQADLDRYEKLHAVGAVSDADIDEYRNTRDVALATLNSARAAADLQKKGNRRQEVEQAEQQVRQSEESLRQAQAAQSTDAVKKADLDAAIAARAQNEVKQADVLAAQAALEEAQSTLRIAQQAVADTVVRAPITGRVSSRSAEPGQIVTSATTLLHVIALNSVYFEPSIPNPSIGQVKVGQSVDVTVDTFPGRTFHGRITHIYPEGSSTSRSFPVRITLDNPEGDLRPQMFAQGRITTSLHRHVVLIPHESLVADTADTDTVKHVFTTDQGIAHERSVKTGLTSPDGAWIEAENLAPGATIVTTGQASLKDGQKITTIPDATGSPAAL